MNFILNFAINFRKAHMLRFKTIREYESKTKKREKTSDKTDKIKEQNKKWLQMFKTTSKFY